MKEKQMCDQIFKLPSAGTSQAGTTWRLSWRLHCYADWLRLGREQLRTISCNAVSRRRQTITPLQSSMCWCGIMAAEHAHSPVRPHQPTNQSRVSGQNRPSKVSKRERVSHQILYHHAQWLAQMLGFGRSVSQSA